MANRRKYPTPYRLFSKGRFGERPYCTGGRRTAYVSQHWNATLRGRNARVWGGFGGRTAGKSLHSTAFSQKGASASAPTVQAVAVPPMFRRKAPTGVCYDNVAPIRIADVSSAEATQSLAFTELRSVSTRGRVELWYFATGECMQHFLFGRWLYCINWVHNPQFITDCCRHHVDKSESWFEKTNSLHLLDMGFPSLFWLEFHSNST